VGTATHQRYCRDFPTQLHADIFGFKNPFDSNPFNARTPDGILGNASENFPWLEQNATQFVCLISSRSGLALITLFVSDKPMQYAETESDDRLSDVLASIRKTSAQNGAQFGRLRGFILYEPDRVHILKPLTRRHWTNTAALNDADEILARMMEEDGWRD
jgi:hypothetical protein